MLDTLGLSVEVPGVDAWSLEGRGWTVCTSTDRENGVLTWARLDDAETGARFRYYADAGWLRVELSLPKFRHGRNDVLLSWQETQEAIGTLTGEVVPDRMGASMPSSEAWYMVRLDPVWAWAVDPTPYLGALHLARLRGTHAVSEPGTVRWRSMRSGRIYARLYNKSQEAGHSVPLPTRFERQLRPRRQVVKVDGAVLDPVLANLQEADLLDLLKGGLCDLGLDRPIKSVSGTRSVLMGAHGRRRGSNLFSELCVLREFGTWPSDYSPQKVRRIERQCMEAGVGMVSLDGELPALEVQG